MIILFPPQLIKYSENSSLKNQFSAIKKGRQILNKQNSRALSSTPTHVDIEHFKVIIPQKMLMQTGRTSPKTLCPTTTSICIKHKLHHSDTSELINLNIQNKKLNVNDFFCGRSTIYFFSQQFDS